MKNSKFFSLQKAQLLLIYCKDTVRFNAPFSLLAGCFGMSIGFLDAFAFSFLTGGFLLSVYFHNMRYKEEYYFYYNKGLSNFHLWAGCFTINTMFIVLLYFLTNLLK